MEPLFRKAVLSACSLDLDLGSCSYSVWIVSLVVLNLESLF